MQVLELLHSNQKKNTLVKDGDVIVRKVSKSVLTIDAVDTLKSKSNNPSNLDKQKKRKE